MILPGRINENQSYHRTQMQKEIVIQKLKEQGCRITKQRLMLLDIILNEDCSNCKEIYHIASKQNPKIGVATVYRMVNTLEDIGAIRRKNIYKIASKKDGEADQGYTILLDDDTVHHLSEKHWFLILREGLKVCGYVKDQKIKSVEIHSSVYDVR